jgi:hypothetical protein
MEKRYVFMAWCLVKYKGNFTFYFTIHAGTGTSEDITHFKTDYEGAAIKQSKNFPKYNVKRTQFPF